MLDHVAHYDVLGNTFILWDARQHQPGALITHFEQPTWAKRVQTLCDANTGLGVDGLLVLRHATEEAKHPVLCIYNADGSDGEFCGNGIRAGAHYLFQENHTQHTLTLSMHGHAILCHREAASTISADIYHAYYQGIWTENHGHPNPLHQVHVGNPHLIAFEALTKQALIRLHHACLAANYPPVNLSACWAMPETPNTYALLVHERGVGFSLACGSAVLASYAALTAMPATTLPSALTFSMPGGNATCRRGAQNGLTLSSTLTQPHSCRINMFD